MEDGPHVMLAGRGVEQFAKEKGLELVPNEWFDTPERRDAAMAKLLAMRAMRDAAQAA